MGRGRETTCRYCQEQEVITSVSQEPELVPGNASVADVGNDSRSLNQAREITQKPSPTASMGTNENERGVGKRKVQNTGASKKPSSDSPTIPRSLDKQNERDRENVVARSQSDRRNVIFIGETGSWKSSVINLIAGRNLAMVSPDLGPCTTKFSHYDVSIEGEAYRLWDTPGLNGTPTFRSFLASNPSTQSLRQFLQERHQFGELDLLVFCVQGNRAINAISSIYNIFCRPTRRIAPVIIAVTHLERQQPIMEAWWRNNERSLGDLGCVFDGYACLTCVSPHHRRWASQEGIRSLISAPYRPRAGWSLSSEEYLSDEKGCTIC
ncbi:hypothetical protein V8E55_006587 [Tylopilus felleus]